MGFFIFIWHYLLAILFLWVPKSYTIYYAIAIVLYLFFRYKSNMNTNKYYDIHPFLLGYSSLWIANVFSNMETKTVGCALVLFIYMVILYHEKEKVEKRVNTEITKTMLYIVAIPVSAFFVILYLFEQQTTAFVAYYACLFYGIYRNDLKKEAWMLAVVVCCNSVLLMLYAFQFVPFGWIEKTIFLITFVCGILWIPVRGKKTKARG